MSSHDREKPINEETSIFESCFPKLTKQEILEREEQKKIDFELCQKHHNPFQIKPFTWICCKCDKSYSHVQGGVSIGSITPSIRDQYCSR